MLVVYLHAHVTIKREVQFFMVLGFLIFSFLAHLSRRLEWAIAVRFRPSSVVRRP